MAVKTKTSVNPTVKAKAKQLLKYANEKVRTCEYSSELFNAIFSPGGKASEYFPTKADRAAFFRTKEYKAIRQLSLELPDPPVNAVVDFQVNGTHAVTVRLPKSIHAALLKEAAAEGVALDQLCLAKLIAQLRELV